jgi:hypothetical protein
MNENIFSYQNSDDSFDLTQKINNLEIKIMQLERNLQILSTIARNPIVIENMYIRRIDADKLQFKLDSIDVKELSGMLNVGVNSGGKFKKKDQHRKT